MSAGLLETDSMISVRETPWHGLGKVLETRPKTIAEVLTLAGLDWTVSKDSIYIQGAKGAYTEVPGHFAVVRNTDKMVLGTVMDRYQPRQNHEAFAFLESILGELIVETAGSLYNGRIVWLMVCFPDFIEVGGDQIAKYCYVRTTHDGTAATTVRNTPVRVVCKNTDTAAISAATATYAVRHLSNASALIHEARDVLKLSVNYFKQFEKVGMKLASKRLTEKKLDTIMRELYPMETGLGDRAVSNREEAYEQVRQLFTDGPTVGNAPGTAWCGYNAIVEWRDHYSDTASAEGTFNRMMTDPAQAKQRALEMVASAVGVAV